MEITQAVPVLQSGLGFRVLWPAAPCNTQQSLAGQLLPATNKNCGGYNKIPHDLT